MKYLLASLIALLAAPAALLLLPLLIALFVLGGYCFVLAVLFIMVLDK